MYATRWGGNGLGEDCDALVGIAEHSVGELVPKGPRAAEALKWGLTEYEE